MTYKEFKEGAYKLLFEYSNKGVVQIGNANNKDAMLQMAEALNYAQNDIAWVAPIVRQYRIESGAYADRFDLRELTREDGRTTYLRLSEIPLISAGRIPAHHFEQNDVLVLDEDLESPLLVQYNYMARRLNEKTPDDYELEYPDDINGIMMYFVAARIAPDGNEELYAPYKDMYDEAKAQLQRAQGAYGRETFLSVTGY